MNAEKIRGSITTFLMTLPPSHFLSPFSWTPLNILSYFLNDPWSGCNWLGWIKLLLKISLYDMYKLIFSIKSTPIIYFYTKSQRTQHKLNINPFFQCVEKQKNINFMFCGQPTIFCQKKYFSPDHKLFYLKVLNVGKY